MREDEGEEVHVVAPTQQQQDEGDEQDAEVQACGGGTSEEK